MEAAEPTRGSPRQWALALAVLGGVALIGALLGWRLWLAPRPAPGPPAMPTSVAIEERWGIRISQIAVTADGGLVDVRYIVLDPDKALAMVQDVRNLPVLIASNGQVVNSAAMMAAKHNFAPGRTYFLLYRNTNGAIRPGDEVTLIFRDVRLEHVIAQ